MSEPLAYRDVEHFLRTASTSEPPYDFNGLLHLVMSGVDNLREHAIEQDFADFASSITDDQTQFLRKLLNSREQGNRHVGTEN